jgi:hypothetical protein
MDRVGLLAHLRESYLNLIGEFVVVEFSQPSSIPRPAR